jgi:hypothetical protein
MDYYGISLSPTQRVNPLNVEGLAFFYVDAAAAAGVDTRITVTPAGQASITLKPGQNFRLREAVNTWTVVNTDTGATFTGNVIIGSGQFEDNNATINGVVAVAMQGTPTVNLSAGTKVQEELIAYTGSWSSNAGDVANTAVLIVSAATNVNGITVLKSMLADGTGAYAFLAKAGAAPVSLADGDLININAYSANPPSYRVNDNRIKIPAGKGLFYISTSTSGYLKAISYVVH